MTDLAKLVEDVAQIICVALEHSGEPFDSAGTARWLFEPEAVKEEYRQAARAALEFHLLGTSIDRAATPQERDAMGGLRGLAGNVETKARQLGGQSKPEVILALIERLRASATAWEIMAKQSSRWNDLPQSEREAALSKALDDTIAENQKLYDLRDAVLVVQDELCGLLCPTKWKTADGPPPHSPKCAAIRIALHEIRSDTRNPDNSGGG